MIISNSLLKWLASVESLEPTIDRSSADIVPLGKFSLCGAVLVRNCCQQSLCWLFSLDNVECILKIFDGDFVEMVHYKQQQLMGR